MRAAASGRAKGLCRSSSLGQGVGEAILQRGRGGPAADPQEGTRGTERLNRGNEEQDATATCPNDEWITLSGGWETTGGVYVTASYRTASHHGWVVTGALLNPAGSGTVTAIVYCVPDEVTLEE